MLTISRAYEVFADHGVEWRASGIAETSKARPQAFTASRSGLEPRAQTWLPSAGDCRWTTTAGAHRGTVASTGAADASEQHP
jgi:hypothetical protein